MPYSWTKLIICRLNFENISISFFSYEGTTFGHTYRHTYIHTDRQTELKYYIRYLNIYILLRKTVFGDNHMFFHRESGDLKKMWEHQNVLRSNVAFFFTWSTLPGLETRF